MPACSKASSREGASTVMYSVSFTRNVCRYTTNDSYIILAHLLFSCIVIHALSVMDGGAGIVIAIAGIEEVEIYLVVDQTMLESTIAWLNSVIFSSLV